MELRHLRYTVAVAEELHFRQAAERVFVAQLTSRGTRARFLAAVRPAGPTPTR